MKVIALGGGGVVLERAELLCTVCAVGLAFGHNGISCSGTHGGYPAHHTLHPCWIGMGDINMAAPIFSPHPRHTRAFSRPLPHVDVPVLCDVSQPEF
jgi:hypothetical protein